MSHFVVIVAGENVEEQLEPYFEQVESNSPYAEFEDMTEEVMEEWTNGTKDEWYPRFNEHIDEDKFNEILGLRGEETAKVTFTGYISTGNEGDKIKLIKKGTHSYFVYTEIVKVNKRIDGQVREATYTVKKIEPPKEIPLQMVYPTFKEFLDRHMGYLARKDPDTGEERFGYYHNPNSKWDWYQIGGRWAGFLKVKDGAEKSLGEYSWAVSNSRREELENGSYASVAFKKDIDIEGMEEPLRVSAEDAWDKWHKQGFGKRYLDLKRDNKGKIIGGMPEDLRKFLESTFGFLYSSSAIEKVNTMSREDYVRKQSIWCPYAFLCDGDWYSRGDMGWFGMSANEDDAWPEQFKKMWDELPDDTLISVVDCHI